MTALVAVLLAAQPNPYLSQARVLHQGLDFEKCLKRLDQASRWDNGPGQLAEIELYTGLCSFGLGREREAAEHFEMGLKIDPKLALPPLVGPKVTGLFNRARAKVVPSMPEPVTEPVAEAKPEAKPVEPPPPKLEPKPAEEPAPAVVDAAAPEKKPVRLAVPLIIAGAGVAAAGLAGYFGVTARGLEARAGDMTAFQTDTIAWAQQARTDALIANVCWAVAGVALLVAVITVIALN